MFPAHAYAYTGMFMLTSSFKFSLHACSCNVLRLSEFLLKKLLYCTVLYYNAYYCILNTLLSSKINSKN